MKILLLLRIGHLRVLHLQQPKSELVSDLGECHGTAQSLKGFGRKPDFYVKLSLDMEDYYRIMDAEGGAKIE